MFDVSAVDDSTAVLDVTLRDGGYVNGHSWQIDDARSVVAAMADAGLAYTEVGYLRTPVDSGRPAFTCPDWYVAELAELVGGRGIAVMCRPGDVPPARLRTLPSLGASAVRVLVREADMEVARPYVETAAEAGLTTMVNIVRVSERGVDAVAALAERAVAAGARVVYLADSNGSMFPEIIPEYVAAVTSTGAAAGFHAHDNLGLAFVNAREAMAAGARMVDASLLGIGKGGGNLDLELVAAHLIRSTGARLSLEHLRAGESVVACRLKMLSDGRQSTITAGLLDVNLEGAVALNEQIDRIGPSALLRAAHEAAAKS